MAATQSHRPSLHSLPRSGENMKRTQDRSLILLAAVLALLEPFCAVPGQAFAARTVPMWRMQDVCFFWTFPYVTCKPGEKSGP